MPRDISDLLSAALALPADQRGQLITALIDSLDSEEEMVSPAEVEAAWKAEVERREAELDANPTSAVPAEAVFAEARRQLEEIRAARKRPA
jgi:putative addiction module component (TIGR02574 family)